MTPESVLLFVVFPYLAMAVFFLGTIYRYRRAPFSYSSLSSQFLENRQHFWGLVPFHYGIVTVLLGHLVALLLPRQILAWNAVPLRLYLLEITALAAGLLTAIGLVGAMVRRVTVPRARVVTSLLDWIVLSLLLLQAGSGVYLAVFHPWGSSWFSAAVAPYLWSLFWLRPDPGAVAAMPVGVKLHFAGAFLLVGLTPFTRLVHVLVAPVPYLWRKPQVVRWYRGEGTGARAAGDQERLRAGGGA